jgi:hypothetical protein
MPTEAVIQRAFLGGELSPALGLRADLPRYGRGLRRCRNCWVRREGGVENRPGWVFMTAAKVQTSAVRYIPFIFEGADQTYVIEAGHEYFRWLHHGAPVVVPNPAAWSAVTAYVVGDLVLEGGVAYYCLADHTNQPPPDAAFWYPLTALGSDWIYEVPHPYAAADLFSLQWAQSADVLTIVHPDYAPRELQRLSHTTWRLVIVETKPWADPPANLAGTAATAGTRTLRYVVTAAKADTFEETYASAVLEILNAAAPTEDAPQPFTWDAVPGAGEYYVHADPFGNGVVGFIGTAKTNAFSDPGFVPDYSLTPPVERTLFDQVNSYPAVVAYYQQRRWFGRSHDDPETVWGSRVGDYANFAISTPLQDDDAVTFVLAANLLHPVHHLLALKRLVLLSDAGEWLIRGGEDGGITPTSINPDQEGYVGADPHIRPLPIANGVVYVQARGTVVRDLRYEFERQGLGGRDLTIVAGHLFEGVALRALAWQQQPSHLLWAVRSDGALLACTYVPEEEIVAWSLHTTGAGGAFEDVVVVPDTPAGEDVLYAVVRRTIGGQTVRYLERLHTRQIDDADLAGTAFFVDSGLTYTGPPLVGAVSGLDHLEGEIVAVLADGQVVFDGDPDHPDAEQYRVAGGQVKLPVPAMVVHAGLPIPFPEIETLALDVEGSSVRDRRKRVQGVRLVVDRSARQLWAGRDADHLSRVRLPAAAPTSPITGESEDLEVTIPAAWTEQGRLVIRHTDPLPFRILGAVPQVEVGG